MPNENWWQTVLEDNFTKATASDTGVLNLSFGGAADKYGNGIVRELDKECFKWVAQKISENTAETKKIKKLSFHGHNSFGDDSLVEVANALRRNEIIDQLSLSKTSVTTVKPLLDALESENNSLTKVIINGTKCTQDSNNNTALYWKLTENSQPLILKMILVKIRNRDPSFQSISLTEHCASQYDDHTLFLVMAALMGRQPSEFNFLAPMDAVEGEASFFVEPTANLYITELRLHHAKLSSVGVKAISDYLSVDSVLDTLSLDHSLVAESSGDAWDPIFKVRYHHFPSHSRLLSFI
eukprot:TRINITY_DN11801_c0_g1_i2.p1 TRINITY_DN11801_c0_g1~~TRINITY_DN11801_c0_g1_i2.p1  ORF type:complete len:310 (+),score=46.56 TRINITY_DN11801_c0_g1_i2:44-931(+)